MHFSVADLASLDVSMMWNKLPDWEGAEGWGQNANPNEGLLLDQLLVAFAPNPDPDPIL